MNQKILSGWFYSVVRIPGEKASLLLSKVEENGELNFANVDKEEVKKDMKELKPFCPQIINGAGGAMLIRFIPLSLQKSPFATESIE